VRLHPKASTNIKCKENKCITVRNTQQGESAENDTEKKNNTSKEKKNQKQHREVDGSERRSGQKMQ
jgi:hypothetical protein